MTPQDLSAKTGESLGSSEWVEMTQEKVNMFADATGDHQFIHIDEEKAKMTPFGGTIVHGFMTLSMIPYLGANSDMPKIDDVKMGVNYGLNKVRFPSPVLVDSRLRLSGSIQKIEDYRDNGIKVVWNCSIEIQGSDKPACVAEFVSLMFE